MTKYYDLARVQVASAPGTGTITLGSAVYGFLTFPLAGVQNGDVVTYAINDGAQSEIGYGTYTTSSNTLSRDHVYSSTNGGISGSKISVSAFAQVFITFAAENYASPPYLDIRNYAVAPLTFNTVGTGSDDTATLQAAVTAANNGYTVVVPAPLILTITSTITVGSNIRIMGEGAGSMASNSSVPAIIYTAASGALFACPGISALEIDHLRIQYTNASYTSNFITFGTSGSNLAEFIKIHDCYIGGNGVSGAASLINVAYALSVQIERNFLQQAVQCIKGGTDSNNIHIADNWFNQGTSCTSHVGVQGEGWVIDSNVFEPTSGTVSNNVVVNGTTQGLSISGNTFNDSGTGNVIDLSGGSASGVAIVGNDVQGGANSINAGSTAGLTIVGNFFAANNTNNVIISSATNVFMMGNKDYAGNLVGTLPSGTYFVDAGDGNGLYGSKVNVANGVTLGVTGTTAGILTFYNTTSGSIVLTPQTGALGSAIITLPDVVDTMAGVAASQALTNKTYNGNTWTSGTGVLTFNGTKTLTVNNSLGLTGTDGTVMTFPTTSATIARTDAGQTFTGSQTFSGVVSLTNSTVATTPTSGAVNLTGSLGLSAETYTNAGIVLYGAVAFDATKPGRIYRGTVTGLSFQGVTGSLNDFSFYTPGGSALLENPTGTSTLEAVRNGTTFLIGATTASTSTTTGALQNLGGFGNAGAIYAGAEIKSTSATAGIGYATGAGGTVTQLTGRTTGVTLNTVTGAITLFSQINTAVSGATAQSFTVTNSAVAATDVVRVSQKSGTDKYLVFVTNTAAGSFQITNYTTGGTTNEAPVFNFAVIKGVTS